MFFSNLLKSAISGIKYLVVSLILMFVSLCLATQQFPPPIRAVAGMIKDLNPGTSSAAWAQAQKDRGKVLDDLQAEIDQVQGKPGSESKKLPTVAGALNLSSDQMSDPIKSLEYEVALLKSKLNRAEGELAQSQSQKPSLQPGPQAVSRK